MKKKITKTEADRRLDIFISGFLGISRNQAQKKIEKNLIKINGEVEKANRILEVGDEIQVLDKDVEEQGMAAPKSILVYEDENIIVVDKDPGFVVYPDENHKSGTILDALRPKISIQDKERPGVVHRLDKDTSGLIVFAKNKDTEEALKKAIKNRKFEKNYSALVWGKVEPERGRIEIPICRSGKDRKKMEASERGKEAFTRYKVAKYYSKTSLLKVKIITGRTHQIRVHFASIGYPVVGDKTYGRRDDTSGLSRQFLHASDLAFKLGDKRYKFHSDLPEDLAEFLKDIDG